MVTVKNGEHQTYWFSITPYSQRYNRKSWKCYWPICKIKKSKKDFYFVNIKLLPEINFFMTSIFEYLLYLMWKIFRPPPPGIGLEPQPLMDIISYYILIFGHPALPCVWVSVMVMRTVYYQVGNLYSIRRDPFILRPPCRILWSVIVRRSAVLVEVVMGVSWQRIDFWIEKNRVFENRFLNYRCF